MYFNWNKDPDFCYNISDSSGTGNLAAGGWDVLTCSQLAMPQTNGNANSSIFTVDDDIFDPVQFTADCQAKYNLTPEYDWALKTFGGKFNFSQEYRQYTKIIFSNGELDPWRAGGVTGYVSHKLPTYTIKGGAHHLDLRLPDAADPEEVKWVRQQEDQLIADWIADYQQDWSGYKGASIYDKVADTKDSKENDNQFIQK